MKKTVSIYGGGWVGAPLAFKLALADYEVLVSASQVHQQAKHPNIHVVDFRANDETTAGDWAQLNQAPIQIWSIPPRRKKNSEEQYLRIVQDWVDGLDPQKEKLTEPELEPNKIEESQVT